MIGRYQGDIVRVVSVLLVPLILQFGIYVIAHGHYGPGGGFAGGVILAVAAVLLRLTVEREVSFRVFPARTGLVCGCAGMLAFALIGLGPVLLGSAFLDYAAFAGDVIAAPFARYLGILVVEIAVGLAVFGAILLIFDLLTAAADATPQGERHP